MFSKLKIYAALSALLGGRENEQNFLALFLWWVFKQYFALSVENGFSETCNVYCNKLFSP